MDEIKDTVEISESEPVEMLPLGVYDAEELADEIMDMREHGLPKGESIGWRSFEHIYNIPKGQWTVLTGYSGSGKSTWLDNVMVNMAKQHGWKFLICSPENQPVKRHVASLMEIYTGKKFGVKTEYKPYFMDNTEFAHATAFVQDHFYFINPPEIDFTVQGVIALAEEVYDNLFEFDGMVLDPYNELEHRRPSAMSETEYISWVISKFRNFTRRCDIHFWFVAHPTKPQKAMVKYNSGESEEELQKTIYKRAKLYDISGSSHWKNKADFGIIVHRDMTDSSAPSIVEIEKVRFRENGKPGEVPLFYDFTNNRFVESYIDITRIN